MKNKIKIRDYIVLVLIITSTVFYDIRPLFLFAQFLAFGSELLIGLKKKHENRSLLMFAIWATAFLFYCVLSLLWVSSDNVTAIPTILSLLQVFIIAITIILYNSDEKNHEKTINFIIISSVFLAARFFIEIPISSWGNEMRFSKNTIFGSNTPAISLAYSSMLIMWKNLKIKPNKKRFLNVVLILLFLFITVLMGTKKSIIIFLLGALLLMVMKSKNLFSTIKTVVIVLSVAVLGYVATQEIPILYGSIGYRINDFTSDISDEGDGSVKSTAVRKKLIEDALNVFKSEPIVGVGQDGYRYENTVGPSYSHCNFTEILANLGIIGFVLYYSIYILILRIAKKSKYKSLIISFVVVMFISDISIVSYLMEYHYILYGLLFGLATSRNNDMIEKSIDLENKIA